MLSSFTGSFKFGKRAEQKTPEVTPVLEPEVLEPAPTVPDPVLAMSTDPIDYPGTGTGWTNSMGQSVSFLGSGYVSDAPVYFALDGSGDYLGTGYVAETRGATVTLEQWLASDDWNSGTDKNYDTALSCAEYGGYRSSIKYGNFISIVHAGGDYIEVSADVSGFEAGSWHHFATTYDGRYLKLYVDGALVGTTDAGGDYDIYYKYNNALIIGAESDQSGVESGKDWRGKIALTRVYNGAWDADGVAALYEENKDRFAN